MYHGLRESTGPCEKVVETVVRRLKSRRDRGAKVDGSVWSLILPLKNCHYVYCIICHALSFIVPLVHVIA